MAERKELMRDMGAIRSKMAEVDAAILAADAASEDTTALDLEFKSLDKQRLAIQRSIARKESLEDDVKDETEDKEVDDDDEDDKPKGKAKKSVAPPILKSEFRSKHSPATRIGAYFWGKAASKAHGDRHAYDTIKRVWGDEAIAKAAVGAMDTTIPTITQDASQVVIDILNTKSIVRASGARIEDMSRGNKTIFRQNAGATAFYFGEGGTSTVSKVGFDHIDLKFHKMGALVYLTKEELLFPSVNTGDYVVQEITRRIALREDATFLFSTGSAFEPTGIAPQIATGNKISSTLNTATVPVVDWQTIANDLASLESLLSGHMVDGPYALYMNQNVVTFLKAVTNGFTFPFRDELSGPNPTLNGHRVFTSQQIATNTTGTNDGTSIYLVKPSHLIVADSYSYDVQMSTEGSFVDGGSGGTQVNLWGEQKVAFLATSAIDFAIEHDVSAAILTAHKWTAAGGAVAGADRYTQAASTTTSAASSVNG